MIRLNLGAAVVAVAVVSASAASADDLPKALAGELVAIEQSSCQTSTGYAEGFVVRTDIDGDGRADVVLDYSKVLCGGRPEPYCENGRCLVVAYRSVGGGWKKVFQDRVAGWRIEGTAARGRLLVDGRPIEP
jgi:hypothetical protein